MSTVAVMLQSTSDSDIVSWDFLSNDIQEGCPSFGNVVGLNGFENFAMPRGKNYGESTLTKVREIVCPSAFLETLNALREKIESHPLVALDFYHQMQRLDHIVFNFLFESIRDLEAVTSFPRYGINQLIERLRNELPTVDGFIMFNDETLRKIVSDYREAFLNEIRGENIPDELMDFDEHTVHKIYGEDVQSSWFNSMSFYLGQPYVMGTVVIGFLGLGFCWKTRRDQQQKQRMLEIFEPIMKFLPRDDYDWKMVCLLDRAGVNVSYLFSVRSYLLLQIDGRDCSITQDDFVRYFTTFFSKITIEKRHCQVFVEEVADEKGHNSRQIQLQLPCISDIDNNFKELMVQVQLAQSDFLREVKNIAPETKIPKLLDADIKFLDPYIHEVMSLLGNELNANGYQEVIDQIVRFIREHVLSNSRLPVDMIIQFKNLNGDSFEKLNETDKLKSLIWLYCQLNTIVQLILQPHKSTNDFFDPNYSAFYRPFANKMMQLKNNGKGLRVRNFYREAESFAMRLNNLVDQIDLTGDFTGQSIMEGIESQLKELVTSENKIRKGIASELARDFGGDLTSLEFGQRCQRLMELESSIKKIKSKIVQMDHLLLPSNIRDFLIFIKDIGGDHAGQLIQSVPILSQEERIKLCEDCRIRMSFQKIKEASGQPQEHQSETVSDWLNISRELLHDGTGDIAQINLGLFYCLSRIVVLLKEEFSEEKYTDERVSLEQLRYLVGHFGYTLKFEDELLKQQLFELSSRLVNRSSEIKQTRLYQALIFHSKVRDENKDKKTGEGIASTKECQAIEKTIHGLQTAIITCSSHMTSKKESHMMHGMMIILGQAVKDFEQQRDFPISAEFQDCLKKCIPIRNRLMHSVSSRISGKKLESIVDCLKQYAQSSANYRPRR